MTTPLPHRQLQPWYFGLECLNAVATFYYFSYSFFYMQSRFGFGDLQNLWLSAASGLVYATTAWFGGWAGQRFGYLRALRWGVCLMLGAMVVGAQLRTPAGLVGVMLVWTFGMSFTWPTLEALACEHEDATGLPRTIGIYNLVWAGGSFAAYFVGGAVLESLGPRSIFYGPAALHLVQLTVLFWLAQHPSRPDRPPAPVVAPPAGALAARPALERARGFLRLAWLAIPFAYMAMNTVIPVIPGLAQRHGLSPTAAGVFCSVWLLARLGSFLALWLWPGWHYRFRWFLIAYLLLGAGFAVILLAQPLWLVLLAQLVFGVSCGLIYYSSLFYSMDVGETKGEHGGIHESAIGAGLFAGPALGAAGLQLAPQTPGAGVGAVSIVLFLGLLAVVWRHVRGRRDLR